MRTLYRIIAAILLSAAAVGHAQPPAASTGGGELPSEQQLQERIKALEGASGLDEQLRKRLLEHYQLALDRISAAENYAATAREFEQLVRSGPAEVKRLQREAQQLAPAPPVAETSFANADLAQIQQALAQEKATLAGLQSQLAEVEEQLRQAQARPPRAREELAAAKLRRQEIERELLTAATAADNERLAQARQASLQAQRLAVINQARMLEQELLSSDARQAILEAQRDLAQRRVEIQAAHVRDLDALANERSLTEAAQSAQQAAEAAYEAHPVVKEAAATNSSLSQRVAQVVEQLEATTAAQQRLQREFDQLQARHRTTQQQLEIAGLSQALGDLLRRERRALPSVSQVARRVDQRQQLIAELRLRQFQLEQERQSSESVERQVAELLATRLPDLDPDQAPQISARLHQLLTDRADLRQKLSINYTRYADQLLELNRIEQQLAAQTLTYQELLDENLFWIASGHPVGLTWLTNVWHSLAWLVDGERWRYVADAMVLQLAAVPLLAAAVALLVALLIAVRPRLRRQLTQTVMPIGTGGDRIRFTLQALWYTLLLALPWPLLMAAVGWLAVYGAEIATFAYGVGVGLRNTAVVVFIIEAFRQLCRDLGVAQVHFRWRQGSRESLRRNLAWLMAVAVPVSFVIGLTEAQPDDMHRDSLGRLAFTIGSVALAVFAWRVLPARFRLVRGLGRERRGGWWRVRRLSRLVATAAPLALAGLALYGYYYTALQLESRLLRTGWLLVALLIVGNLILRWIRLAQRRMMLRPREPMRGIGKGRGEVDPAVVNEQTRRVFTIVVTVVAAIGLWFIWSDLLPALNILEDLVLWESPGGEGAPLVRVTVGDILLAMTMIALTLVAAANLPGVLEITLLHRLEVDPGNRYAITTVSRYIIVAVGLVVALTLIGVRWNQAQWLIAALGVGLGFGLQEIFANFVSGLILLFERPIRVGDTVTVGNLSGRVTRIRIRATTITDWDRRELIIPNKTFITDQLINWTLSDQITRIVLSLRVAYNSPADEVQRILLACAAEHPLVMRDPEPAAFFVGVGDSALEVELHAFVRELADRLPVRHELYADVIRRLKDAGIAIPVPQRDLHIRSIEPERGGESSGTG